MDENSAEFDLDAREGRDFLEDYHRKNMEETRAAVTRGATGIETSYFLDQGAHLSLSRGTF